MATNISMVYMDPYDSTKVFTVLGAGAYLYQYFQTGQSPNWKIDSTVANTTPPSQVAGGNFVICPKNNALPQNQIIFAHNTAPGAGGTLLVSGGAAGSGANYYMVATALHSSRVPSIMALGTASFSGYLKNCLGTGGSTDCGGLRILEADDCSSIAVFRKDYAGTSVVSTAASRDYRGGFIVGFGAPVLAQGFSGRFLLGGPIDKWRSAGSGNEHGGAHHAAAGWKYARLYPSYNFGPNSAARALPSQAAVHNAVDDRQLSYASILFSGTSIASGLRYGPPTLVVPHIRTLPMPATQGGQYYKNPTGNTSGVVMCRESYVLIDDDGTVPY